VSLDDEDIHDDDVKASAPWLITWADMMAVLLTFFIVLQAFSTVSESKFHEAMESIQDAFQITLPIHPLGQTLFYPRDRTAVELQARIAEENVEGISVQDWGDRVVLTVDSALLFDIGRANLTEDGRRALDGLSSVLVDSPGSIHIEGHTCDLPVRAGHEFRNNWWLSTARALTVLEALQGQGVPPERLSATGYAEHDPIATNDSEENRARNRRVEFIIEKQPLGAD